MLSVVINIDVVLIEHVQLVKCLNIVLVCRLWQRLKLLIWKLTGLILSVVLIVRLLVLHLLLILVRHVYHLVLIAWLHLDILNHVGVYRLLSRIVLALICFFILLRRIHIFILISIINTIVVKLWLIIFLVINLIILVLVAILFQVHLLN